MSNQQYDFQWEHLGDIQKGRPNLGELTSVATYRLMQYTLRDVLTKELGYEKALEILSKAGMKAGEEFCRNMLDTSLEMNDFIEHLKDVLIELKMGVLRVEKMDLDSLKMVFTMSEDLDCSGLPIIGVEFCDYDEGFIAGILKVYTGHTFSVKEIDCWATGERICRFKIDLAE